MVVGGRGPVVHALTIPPVSRPQIGSEIGCVFDPTDRNPAGAATVGMPGQTPGCPLRRGGTPEVHVEVREGTGDETRTEVETGLDRHGVAIQLEMQAWVFDRRGQVVAGEQE